MGWWEGAQGGAIQLPPAIPPSCHWGLLGILLRPSRALLEASWAVSRPSWNDHPPAQRGESQRGEAERSSTAFCPRGATYIDGRLDVTASGCAHPAACSLKNLRQHPERLQFWGQGSRTAEKTSPDSRTFAVDTLIHNPGPAFDEISLPSLTFLYAATLASSITNNMFCLVKHGTNGCMPTLDHWVHI